MTTRVWASGDTYKLTNTVGAAQFGGFAPVGSVVAVIPGSYSAGNNIGYSHALLPTYPNTTAGFKAFLTIYAPNWKLCDGTEVYDIESPIFGVAGRFIPNLTNSRFLMGATTAGSVGGSHGAVLTSSTMPLHNHTIPTSTSSSLSFSHTHRIYLSGTNSGPGGTTAWQGANHKHGVVGFSAGGDHSHRAPLGEGSGGTYCYIGAYRPWYDGYGPLGLNYDGVMEGSGAHRHNTTSTMASSDHVHIWPWDDYRDTAENGDHRNHGHSGSLTIDSTGVASPDSVNITPYNVSCFYIMRIK
jgi:hypothetical protein